MTTKSTLKTLWLTGGGLLATWLAVNPSTVTPPGSTLAVTPGATAVRQVTADDLNLQEATLRQHLGSVPLRPSSRNPFRFGSVSARETSRPTVVASAMAPALPAPEPSLSLSLSGMFTDGGKRTAIITGDGQLYLVKAGEQVAGRYRVVTVDSDAVTLRDDAGAETHLAFH